VLFQEVDAVVVEYAPMMLKTLLSIREVASRDKKLGHIQHLAGHLLGEMEEACARSKWCRGSIE
jgi:hypothetical protein